VLIEESGYNQYFVLDPPQSVQKIEVLGFKYALFLKGNVYV